MNTAENIPLAEELGEVEYGQLKETYCRLRELHEELSDIRAAYVSDGTAPTLDQIQALQMQMEELYTELERFLLPVCAPDSMCGPGMCI
ncbi:MAG: hypothetical protein GJT30_04410 [Geobacter sp.]|nr:hypothetical protein [Geobacter sp.]